MGLESDHAMVHRTQPHDDSDAVCFTIVARWCSMWHSFQVPESGRTTAVWSEGGREKWADAAASLADRDAKRKEFRHTERARERTEAYEEERRERERAWGGRITRSRT